MRKYLVSREPWSEGYDDFKWLKISQVLHDEKLLRHFSAGEKLPDQYGKGIDERIVEYPYVISALDGSSSKLLDAGSTFNFEALVKHPVLSNKEITIFTAFPEENDFSKYGISYRYGDLRKLPFENRFFDEVVCISTLEHIGMDNAIYGEEEGNPVLGAHEEESYLSAIDEFIRVLKPDGRLFVTVPFGRKINYGYFQQFDSTMVQGVLQRLENQGHCVETYFRYTQDGWEFSTAVDCRLEEAYNPHTGQGKGSDGAAHSRAICGICFRKSK